MKKAFCMLVIFLLALGSMAGYAYLNKEIAQGSLKIAAGELKIAQGEQMLAKGKAKLSEGEKRLSSSKQLTRPIDNKLLWGVASIVAAPLAAVAVVSSKVTNQKIAAGEQQVSQGREKISSGEGQLAAGKAQLATGIERLNRASKARFACAAGSFIFSALFLGLGYYWCRPLSRFFKRK